MPPPSATAAFVRDGLLHLGPRKEPLWSGALHYFRLDPNAWDPALVAMKDLGMRMVESYVPWSIHERAEGAFDFGAYNPRLNLTGFLDRVAAADMLAFLRPGPHINAELTHFGLPDRIVHDDKLWARSANGQPVPLIAPPHMFAVPSTASLAFRQATRTWFEAVAEQIRPYLWPRGPVVLIQVDNEAAFYFRDGPYDQDYHPDALAFHRQRLRTRYGNDEAISAAYATAIELDTYVPPSRCDAQTPQQLLPAIDWMQTQEELICDFLGDMARALSDVGLAAVPLVHNLPMGDFGLPTNLASVDRTVGFVGLDYYQTCRDFAVIKRRTLRLCGTVETPFAPELGSGAPPWFVPRTNDDSLFTALTALAFGLRGLNLYMTVARDRWYGAPIDVHGKPRASATPWTALFNTLREIGFASLQRSARIGLVIPRQYGQLSRATHKLGAISPSVLDLSGAPAFSACSRDGYGFAHAIQLQWWKWLDAWDAALTRAQIPFVYIDDDARAERFDALDVLIVPSFSTFNARSWQRLSDAANKKTILHGPLMPTLDEHMRPHGFSALSTRAPISANAIDDAVHDLTTRFAPSHGLRVRNLGNAQVELTVHQDAHGPRALFLINPDTEATEAIVELESELCLRDVISGERIRGLQELNVTLAPTSCRMFVVDDHSVGADVGSHAAETP